MTKRPSLFSSNKAAAAAQAAPEPVASQPTPAPAREALTAGRYPKATTREGKRVVTAYLEPEAFRQLKRIGADEDRQQQDLLIEGINLVFEKRGLSRIA